VRLSSSRGIGVKPTTAFEKSCGSQLMERPFQTTVVKTLKAVSQRLSREPKNEETPDRRISQKVGFAAARSGRHQPSAG
jgi:hypothetical protein